MGRRAGAQARRVSVQGRPDSGIAADGVAREMTREEGKTLPEAHGEVGRADQHPRYFGGEGARLTGEQARRSAIASSCHTYRRRSGRRRS